MRPNWSWLGVTGNLGFVMQLRGEKVALADCRTVPLKVPANAEMIIEGRVDFSRKIENVLGEFAVHRPAEQAFVVDAEPVPAVICAVDVEAQAFQAFEHVLAGPLLFFERVLGVILRHA